MIYLIRHRIERDRTTTDIAAVEDDEAHAARYEAQGFARCSYAAFRAAWQRRDRRQWYALVVREDRQPVQSEPSADQRYVGVYPNP